MKTVPVTFETDGIVYFPKQEAQRLLSIRHRQTFNQHLKILGLVHKPITWAEIKEILALKLFLYARLGYHTRAMYQRLKKKGQLPIIFHYYNINVDTEFRRIQHDYYERQRQTQERTTYQGSDPQRPGTVVFG